jgi:hypothetical protein
MVGEIRVEGNSIIFQLQGIDKVLALKSQLRIPIEHIVDVSTERADWNIFNQLRVGGSAFPGILKDGRYFSRKEKGWLFYEMKDSNSCVTVSLKDERYKKIIFEVKDKEESANLIRQAMMDNDNYR